MEHIKTHYSIEVDTKLGKVVVEGPVDTSILKTYEFSNGLTSFRKAEEQFQAIIEISELAEGRIIITRKDKTIVGYATFLFPDPLERWSDENMDNLLELGAIEIDPQYRRNSLSKKILEVSMMDDAMEDYIVITTEYYWHWDLKGSGLSVWDYRKLMEKTMEAGGLVWYATDDEEITSHPANCLMARIGKRVNLLSIQSFDRLRFKYKFMY